ncbi:MAG: class I tRNA ligase family protein [Candidatus Pacebacteria bacterium]|nr:class I tRNA ligase family protein [Candidatus Paceibacterota bacterium]
MENPNNIPEKLLRPYSSKDTEDRIYKKWQDSGFFNPTICVEKGVTAPDAEPFSIVLPPPNVTGTLHTGHALMLVIQDIMTRYARMQGKRTLWLPGTDHAAIATQSKVEKIVEKEEGKRKGDLGREEFLKRVEKFAQESHDTIVNQARRMGASLDWSREAFTLDNKRNLAVRSAFKRMYEDGLIYRGHRIVNWDPKGQTVISDDEMVYVEEKTKFYYLKYGPFTIGTARPETKFGDKYVVMHPDDTRYASYKHGNKLTVEWINGPIEATIIKDEMIDMEFGTGVMTITPWHSVADFELAEKHKLDKEQIIDKYGKLLPVAGEFAGMKISDARTKIIEKLSSKGLVEKVEDYTHNIATAERTGATIEPQVMNQWFVNVNKPISARDGKTLKELMLEPVNSGKIKIMPSQFENVYYNWINNLRDWCISRQIWYGHRIPVWYDKNGVIHLPKEKKVVFLRHGQSEANVADVYDSLGTAHLTEEGKKQALEAAKRLSGRKFGMVISSDMVRAQETAKIVCDELGLPQASIHPELREVFGGDLEGKPRDHYPLLLAMFENKTGETFDELIARAKKAWELIYADKSDEDVLVIGHQSFLCVMRAVMNGVTTEEKLYQYRNKWRMGNATTREYTLSIDPEGADLTQDEDTLDTWFSSGLWTFSTLGWPNLTSPDFKTYHPTTILETGHDTLFFWVARMILMSQYLVGDVPFKTVYLHGLVRDEKGRKMSKSLGNIVDPIMLIDKFGTDALRMAMIVGVGPGSDSNLGEEKIKAYSKFANKLWNIARFVHENTSNFDVKNIDTNSILPIDKEYIAELDALASEITKEMSEYKFYIVAEKLYHYVWHTFADKIIEETKIRLSGEDEQARRSAQSTIYYLLVTNLKLLHPFMPYITEELWHLTSHKKDSMLMVEKWPTVAK